MQQVNKELYISELKHFVASSNKVLLLWNFVTWPIAKFFEVISRLFTSIGYFYKVINGQNVSAKLQPPGPQGYFLLGSLPEFLPNPLNFFNSVWHTYGRENNICRFKLLNKTIYLVTHPEFCQIISTDSQTFVRGGSFDKNRQVLGDSLLTAEGDIWRQKRQKILQHLNLKNIREHHFHIIKDACYKLNERWSSSLIAGENEIDVLDEMSRCTIEVISRSLLGVNLSTEIQDGRKALDVIFEHVFKTVISPLPAWLLNKLPTDANRKYREALIIAKKELLENIKQQQSSNQINYLMQRFAEEGELNEELLNDILNVFLAGYETTAQLLTWSLHEISRRPEIQEKLYREVNSIVNEDVPTIDEINNLPYLAKFLQEVLRIYPSAPIFVRDVTKEVQLGQYTLGKGDIVFVGVAQMGQDTNRWQNPTEFNPDRFGDEEIIQKNTQYDLIPFGSGKHRCVGQTLALMEAKVILATVLSKFNFELVEAVNPIMRGTLHSEKKIKIKIGRRKLMPKNLVSQANEIKRHACLANNLDIS